MRRAVVILPFLVSAAGAQDKGPATSAARVTAQLATGVILTPIGFFGSGWAAKRLAQRAGWSDERARRAAYVSAVVGGAAATAAGPALVGEGGRYGAAFVGAGAGIGAAALVARLGNRLYDGAERCGPLCWALGAVTIALPSIGATVAYQASRP